jgi:nucleoside-diphosphate-sugar epimerase
VLYRYRRKAQSPQDEAYDYEKILIEREVMNDSSMPGTVFRLPQVYRPGCNADLVIVSFLIASAVATT